MQYLKKIIFCLFSVALVTKSEKNITYLNQTWPLRTKDEVDGSLVYPAIALLNKNLKYTE